jgi:hypothetical protein
VPEPSVNGSAPALRSYHGQPILKEPVWTWEIPAYFYVGGLAGASAGLAYLSGLRENPTLAKRAWAIALAGNSVSPVLLIMDLGRPTRFLNMMRMVKPTSPMSIGSWILLANGNATAVATAHALLGWFPRLSRSARPAAAGIGLALATYTGALVANTAVPVWHEARRELPLLFGAGAALSAGAAAAMATPVEVAAPARRLALAAAAAELGLEAAMEHRLGDVGDPYHEGTPKLLAQVSRVTITAGAALLGLRGANSRRAAVAAGALLTAGAVATRWSVFRAGFVSARDPKYVVGPQRSAVERGMRRGAARSTPTAPAAPSGTPTSAA